MGSLIISCSKSLELSELGKNMGGLPFSFIYDVAFSCDVDEKTHMSRYRIVRISFLMESFEAV